MPYKNKEDHKVAQARYREKLGKETVLARQRLSAARTRAARKANLPVRNYNSTSKPSKLDQLALQDPAIREGRL